MVLLALTYQILYSSSKVMYHSYNYMYCLEGTNLSDLVFQ